MIQTQFETIGSKLIVRAPAKINLSLLIAGKRPDGFHAIETVMAKVNYYDEIHIEPGDKQGIELICRGPHWAPDGPENLVYKAAQLILNHLKQSPSLRLTLIKNIPAGTGLGSASSDAAATLIGLNRYLKANVPLEILSEMCASLGSDITFFLHGPIAYCTGRGEKVQPLKQKIQFTAILCLSGINVSTAKIYKNYIHRKDHYQQLHREISDHISKNRIDLLTKMCPNMLAYTCYNLETDLAALRDKIEVCGIGPVYLSGSGSAMFIMVEGGMEVASKIQDTIEETTHCLTRVVTNNRW